MYCFQGEAPPPSVHPAGCAVGHQFSHWEWINKELWASIVGHNARINYLVRLIFPSLKFQYKKIFFVFLGVFFLAFVQENSLDNGESGLNELSKE